MNRSWPAEIGRYIDEHRDAMRDLLTALVAIPTENPPGTSYGPYVQLLEASLRALGFKLQRIDIDSPADAPLAALLASIGQRGATLPNVERGGHPDLRRESGTMVTTERLLQSSKSAWHQDPAHSL